MAGCQASPGIRFHLSATFTPSNCRAIVSTAGWSLLVTPEEDMKSVGCRTSHTLTPTLAAVGAGDGCFNHGDRKFDHCDERGHAKQSSLRKQPAKASLVPTVLRGDEGNRGWSAQRRQSQGNPVTGDDDGDVVLAAAIQGQVDEGPAGLGGGGLATQLGRDRRVIDHVGQAVGAEQQPIAVGQLESPDLRLAPGPRDADGVGQHVSVAVRGDVLGRRSARGRPSPAPGCGRGSTCGARPGGAGRPASRRRGR